MLEISVKLYQQPDIINEYEQLRKQHIRQQKEDKPRTSDRDPLAEFEELFIKWQRT